MGEPKNAPEPVYGPEELKDFAEILGIQEFRDQLAHQLQLAAWKFEFLNSTDEMRAMRAERRKVFQRIHDAAHELKDALENYYKLLIDGKADLPFSNTRLLGDLAEAAKQAADSVPPSGADPKQARRAFVHDLGEIFWAATGKRPTLRRHPDGRPYGPFFEFVETALGQLDRYAVQGVESDVKAIVAEMAKLDP